MQTNNITKNLFFYKSWVKTYPVNKLAVAYLQIIVNGSHTRNSCAYRDHFDGTYTACCVLRETHNTIEFYIMSVNFTSYQAYFSHHQLIDEVHVKSLEQAADGKCIIIHKNGSPGHLFNVLT